MPSLGDPDGIIFRAHSKNDTCADRSTGINFLTQQILTIRRASKQQPPLML